jgi:hypothetical protein
MIDPAGQHDARFDPFRGGGVLHDMPYLDTLNVHRYEDCLPQGAGSISTFGQSENTLNANFCSGPVSMAPARS